MLVSTVKGNMENEKGCTVRDKSLFLKIYFNVIELLI